jgi:AAA+ ATPase superfamily predicted ATPase
LDREEEIEKVEEKYSFEVKWHEFERVKEAKKIIEVLKEKSKFVTWVNDAREEYFGLIAKKMGEEMKAALRTDGYLVFDMTELKNHKTNLFASK